MLWVCMLWVCIKVRELSFKKANLKEDLPAGSYSCITVEPQFYANFLRDCDVLPAPQKSMIGQQSVSLSSRLLCPKPTAGYFAVHV
jgi:hypothetical protein